MEAKQHILKQLLEKHLDAAETPEEAEELDALMEEFTVEEITDVWLLIIADKEYEDDGTFSRHDWDGGLRRVLAAPVKKPVVRKMVYLWYAAMFLAAVATGAVIWLMTKPKLTGSDSCGLVQPSGDEVDKLIKWHIKNGINTVSISPGWQYETTLPDGTKVVLNSGSSVTYPTEFKSYAPKEVQIEGEVFFDVAEDTLHPLYVTARGRRFEAPGTAFNINAYPDSDSVYATLIRGNLVAVNGDDLQFLKPGEQIIAAAQTDASQPLDPYTRLTSGDLAQLRLWQQGYFSFRGSPVRNVMQELARWYQWKVEYRSYMQRANVTRTFCRRSSEKQALAELRQAGVRFEKIGDRIIID